MNARIVGRMDLDRRGAARAASVWGLAVGVAATGVLATLWSRFPFPPVQVAERVANLTPGGVATFFIELLHHFALPLTVLLVGAGLILVTLGLAALLPGLADRIGAVPAALVLSLPPYVVALGAFDPSSVTTPRSAYAPALGACVVAGGIAAGYAYRRLLWPSTGTPAAKPDDPSRRVVLRAGLVGGLGFAAGWLQLGRSLFPGGAPDRALDAPTVARTAAPARPLPAFDVPGLAPVITPNDDFYTVDEEIVDPIVDAGSWRLRIVGAVDAPFELTYDELLALPQIEQHATLECISNPVGGDLISTATWTGVPLATLLERAGVRDGAVEVVSRAIGGYSDSLPLADALRPVTIVAVGMNGRVLPRKHGYPARLLAPGYFGMKQPKWLEQLEVVTEPYAGYWEQRGWVKAAVVRTMSRVDGYGDVAGGTFVAGVAFAGDRGISRVEVSLDGDTTWADAELERPLSGLTWRRWRLPVDPGTDPEIVVRATDGDGAVQPAEYMDPHPSGATGLDRVTL
jgi:DMSO/TMAO reductase YedYZ molybdopterin-dependent catalytic subunit